MAISYDELISTLALMLVGRNETSRKLVGNAIVALDAHPDQLERLRHEPELTAGAIEEFIRYDGVAVQFVRTARKDVEFDGVVVPAGAMLFGSVHAANRDPEVFVDPDRLDVTRENRRSHVGLGVARTSASAPPSAGWRRRSSSTRSSSSSPTGE